MNKGTVKWFNNAKGYGFITDENGKDYFVHYSSIVMDGRKQLSECDIVEFEVGNGTTGREQAVNVQPILTKKMVADVLRNKHIYVHNLKDAFGARTYMLVDENNIVQAGEQGMTLVEAATYAGIDVEGLK